VVPDSPLQASRDGRQGEKLVFCFSSSTTRAASQCQAPALNSSLRSYGFLAASRKDVSHRTEVAQKKLRAECKFGQWARSPEVMSSASLAQAFSVDTPVQTQIILFI
jgi:hypothetical protein